MGIFLTLYVKSSFESSNVILFMIILLWIKFIDESYEFFCSALTNVFLRKWVFWQPMVRLMKAWRLKHFQWDQKRPQVYVSENKLFRISILIHFILQLFYSSPRPLLHVNRWTMEKIPALTYIRYCSAFLRNYRNLNDEFY